MLYVFFSFPNVEITDLAAWLAYKIKLAKDYPHSCSLVMDSDASISSYTVLVYCTR